MGTSIFYISESGDDWYYVPGGGSFSKTADYWRAGSGWGGGIRLQNVTIPQGTTITSAFFRAIAWNTRSGANANPIEIIGVDEDDFAQPSSSNDVINANKTTATVNAFASQNWTDGDTIDSPEIKTIVQEIVNRAGWSSGNAMTILIRPGSAAPQVIFSSYDFDTAEKAELHISYSTTEEVSQTDGVAMGDSMDADTPYRDQTDDADLGDTIDGTSLTATQTHGTDLGDSMNASPDYGSFTDDADLGDTIDGSAPKGFVLDDADLGDSSDVNVEYETNTVTDDTDLDDTIDAFSLSQVLTDDADLGDTIDGVNMTGKIQDDADLGDSSDREREAAKTLPESMDFGDTIDGFNFSQWIATRRDLVTYRYECTLTGAPDGEEDVELPIKSLQARMRTGSQSFLSVQVPGLDYAEEIADRPNGELVIEMVAYVAGVEELREEIIRVDLDAVRTYQGTSSKTITLEGHKTTTFDYRESPLNFVTYRSVSDGKYTIRCAVPDWYLKPGHLATYDGNSFTVESISFYVNVTDQFFQSNMEVYE